MEQGSVEVVHRRLPFDLLEEITNSFSSERKLGHGAYGNVYKGVCKDGETIAVKLFHETIRFDEEQFDKEYLNLTSVQHKNIVRVVAYCYETRRECAQYNGRTVLADNTKRAVCFEYIHDGCLSKHLSDESCGHDWQTRYQIIKGICEGMKYLHEGSGPPMLHLDLKPDNILLDHNLVPKIADFGMSRLVGEVNTHQTQSGIGTIGYQPPEYIDAALLSIKFDIYSLGVVIIKILTGPSGYYRTAEMSSQDFIELVHAKWRNRLQATSVNTLESFSQQVKRCIELALSCVDANRDKRPCMGVIMNKLIETEDMIRIPGESRSTMFEICHSESSSDSESSTCIRHRSRILPVPPNAIEDSQNHIYCLFNSTGQRLSYVPESPWILKAGETFADPCELTNESTGIWVMKLKTTAGLFGLSERELHEHNWELCEEAREECLERLLEVAYSFSDARWSVDTISHQLTIFGALVDVLFNISFKRCFEVFLMQKKRYFEEEASNILNKMVKAFQEVMLGTSCGINSGESTIDPATTVLVQALYFFGLNRETVQSILESGDCNIDPCSDIFNTWVCKLNESAEFILFEKGRRSIFILNNGYYVLQTICRPGLLLPDVVSNLRSLIDQYSVGYLDESSFSLMVSYLDGDSLKKPQRSSLDKFMEVFYSIFGSQMTWKVHGELKYILREKITDIIVPKYRIFLEALQTKHRVSWKPWSSPEKIEFTVEQLEQVIQDLFEQ